VQQREGHDSGGSGLEARQARKNLAAEIARPRQTDPINYVREDSGALKDLLVEKVTRFFVIEAGRVDSIEPDQEPRQQVRENMGKFFIGSTCQAIPHANQ
jgi:hypothetical protein